MFFEPNKDEKMILENLKSGEAMHLNEVKEKSALSGKKWDKSIKNLTKNNVVKVEKIGEDLTIIMN